MENLRLSYHYNRIDEDRIVPTEQILSLEVNC